MKKQKIEFRKLIGNHYPLEVKMEVFNWMLSTGKKHCQYIGKWDKVGISQALIGYSANDHDAEFSLKTKNIDLFFDAVFAN